MTALWLGGGKRAVDVVASLAVLVLAAPLLAIVAVLVRLRLGSPVLFRHERPGLLGEPFTLLKFRTMTDERGPDGELLPDDQRMTAFGRTLRATSLDELPELWNVLQGDMSLVGPRPLLTAYLDRYSPEQARRHEVRPGLTGWAQVNGRNTASWDDKLAMDVWYVDNVSFGLDVRVVLRTLQVLVRREGISAEGHVTAPEFQGPATPDPTSTLPDASGPTAAPTRGTDVTTDDQPELELRAATDADLPAILELLQASLGWVPDDQYASFFSWKHHENPFGRSPWWVAVDGDRIAGLRVWLRWAFEDGTREYSAVRAVDTATHPDYRGRGVFRRLTTSSLDALAEEGVDFVFNTPNEQSRPGYLKMGWEQVGQLPVRVRPTGPVALARMARSRVPADKWSQPCDGGLDAATVLEDEGMVSALLAARPAADGRLRTLLDPAVLRWRYGFPDLHYRAVLTRDRRGLALFRVRRRGAATECVIGHVLTADPALEGPLVRRAAAVSGADYALRIGGAVGPAGGFLPLPGQGPVLTWREVTHGPMPALDAWDLTMGDVELF